MIGKALDAHTMYQVALERVRKRDIEVLERYLDMYAPVTPLEYFCSVLNGQNYKVEAARQILGEKQRKLQPNPLETTVSYST